MRWTLPCVEGGYALDKECWLRERNAYANYLAGDFEMEYHQRPCAVLKLSIGGMRWTDYNMELEWRTSRWYIYKWTENSIVLLAFQSSSWVHIKAKHRREVEEDVHTDLKQKSHWIRKRNLGLAEVSAAVISLEWCSVLEEEQIEEMKVRVETLRLVS